MHVARGHRSTARGMREKVQFHVWRWSNREILRLRREIPLSALAHLPQNPRDFDESLRPARYSELRPSLPGEDLRDRSGRRGGGVAEFLERAAGLCGAAFAERAGCVG